MHGLFITATDTGAGKTFVSCAIAGAWRRQQRFFRVCKPVATGAEWDGTAWLADDTRLLAEAAGENDDKAVTPWSFEAPAAPPVAARAAGAQLKLAELAEAVRRRTAGGATVLVEGVGGLLCPLTEQETVADLVAALGLSVVVVARRSLGTLNHTLLTVEVARGRGLSVAGVVVTETAPVRGLAEETNVVELQRRLVVPLLAIVPHLPGRARDVPALDAVDWWALATHKPGAPALGRNG